MFNKILIANRGEIACRIIRSAKRMGITTVAVYSEADADALHVQLADEAVAIGPAASAESYLVIEKIVQACKDSGAQAVHPGFGFLSENAAFVKALDEADIVFIGPPTLAIGAMGDKIESKRLAADANVSTVPGHMDLIEDAEEAVKISGEIGYPVMIKASAGGGGKGMRVAWNEEEARDGFRSARSEARTSFGDERIFIEKFVEEPRHIEIQVLADKHGNTLHLGERECSIQRRHQKVIEEAPSPFLDEETRQAMGAQAVALAQAVDYCSAGTVEFIVDKSRNFYFLEMNTRIQVEHPVTEMITGLDLVEWMIRIAAGEKLDFGQADVKLKGWAMESRVYAEDPLRSFLPSIGRLVKYNEPEVSANVRIDSGVEEGSEITMFYDPMIAKLVTYGADRGAALKEMQAALDAFHIRGINHNMGFLAAVMAKQRFRDGRLTTNFIAEEFPDGFKGGDPDESQRRTIAAAAATAQHIIAEREAESVAWDDLEVEVLAEEWVVCVGTDHTAVSVCTGMASYDVGIDGGRVMLETDWVPGEALFTGLIDGEPVTVQIDRVGPRLSLTHAGVTLDALVLRPHVAALNAVMPIKAPPDLSKFLLSPMPGLLVSLAVEVGQSVKSGEELAVVEAMKMENLLRAQQDGVVAAIKAAPGESLSVDQIIMEFE
ncbi:acetyl/propionyl/methylcrotonyl-CoA carboxylase subunit alpha [Pelagibius sp. Alg239-R121]|uniref:acetyl-CoA carboxylase biotin carboxylase subunit n=1 Tax=Pelagibius sp. Alg239-R121 TaxID=2993448 RepID=UPI0024A6EE92|nr:acetyl/propionyl/methylcrotonyl-CoA carboxylase subunit alpha [Pelagibius sp. Alg239-R121]